MCEFCTKHGEGKKWYLNANNYSTELLNELKRKNLIGSFYNRIIGDGNKKVKRIEKLFKKNPKLTKRIAPEFTREMKIAHFGQVIPVEDVNKIFNLANSIVRLTCGCSWELEKKEKRCCFGISIGPPDWFDEVDKEYFGSPDVSKMEYFNIDDAIKCVNALDNKEMVHSMDVSNTIHRSNM
ncbi:MAG: hypothetical protein P9M03_00650 [Candidatus Theseobacter exili]|nr:hypothetical protein [Candidatus Theseobacter exili]